MSDNELDAELLALAGDGDSSDDEDAKAEESGVSRSHSPTPTRSAADPSEKVLTPSPPQKGVAQKKTTDKPTMKTSKRSRKNESEEEGEASTSPSTPNSLGSRAMSESESDTSPGEAGSQDGVFPLEGKYYSEKDKAEIMALSEIQREAILAERAQEVERKTQDLHLRRLLQARERAGAKADDKKKRKAGTADLDDNQRKSSRQKVKASEPLEALKRQRAEWAEQRRRQDDKKKRQRRSSSAAGGHSDADAEGESEVEWDNSASKTAPAVPEEPPADLKDFERVRVGRTNFAKVCFYPGFAEAITGCFCRVSIGVDRATGQNLYRMAQIKGFTEGKPYGMEAANGKNFITDMYAIVSHGKAEKEWPFLACSDGKFTEAEFERYKGTVLGDNLKVPTKQYLSVKLDGIHALLNHRWTEEDIAAKLKRQNKYANMTRPVFGMPNPNAAKVSKGPSQQERLAALNRANRKANAEDVRKAQIAEKRAEAAARAAAAAKHARMEKEAAERAAAKDLLGVPKGSNTDDLFGSASDISRTGTPAGISTPKKIGTPRSQTPLSGPKPERKPGISGLKKRNMDDDLIAAMDLGIEIDI